MTNTCDSLSSALWLRFLVQSLDSMWKIYSRQPLIELCIEITEKKQSFFIWAANYSLDWTDLKIIFKWIQSSQKMNVLNGNVNKKLKWSRRSGIFAEALKFLLCIPNYFVNNRCIVTQSSTTHRYFAYSLIDRFATHSNLSGCHQYVCVVRPLAIINHENSFFTFIGGKTSSIHLHMHTKRAELASIHIRLKHTTLTLPACTPSLCSSFAEWYFVAVGNCFRLPESYVNRNLASRANGRIFTFVVYIRERIYSGWAPCAQKRNRTKVNNSK